MFESWKFSKGSLITFFAVALIGGSVLGLAYHLQHFSEVLSGVIGGLTIILGMITAEWLRSSREQVERTRQRFVELDRYWDRFIYNTETYFEDPYAVENSIYHEDQVQILHTLILLARTTRWPQPNAKEIREQAWEVESRFRALISDGYTSKHSWSLEKRFDLSLEANKLMPLIWDKTPVEVSEIKARIDAHRETSDPEGLPEHWLPRRTDQNLP